MGYVDEGYATENGQILTISCIDFHTSHIGHIAPMHYHNYIEILYGNSCDCVVYISEKCYDFRSGDLCFINTKQPHFLISKTAPTSYFVIKFSPSILSYNEQNLSELKYILPVLSANEEFSAVIKKDALQSAKIKKIIADTYNEWFNSNICREFVLRGQILQLFSELMRAWDINHSFFLEPTPTDSTSYDILKAVPYITENYAGVTEKDVADHCKISYSYFSHLFKKFFGCSFSKYLTITRLEAAKRRLLVTNDSITTIAHEVGFSSSSHFISAFKQNFNTTPLAFRKQANMLVPDDK